jgi:autotransporter-associated beta strand protein
LHNGTAIFCHTAACLIGFTANLQAVDLINDTFSDNERATQTLPSSAQWFLRTASAVPTPTGLAAGYTAAGGNLDLPYISPSAAHTQLAYFTASNAPIALVNDGDAITLSLSVTMDQIASGADSIRFGFFNSAFVRLAADDAGNNATTQLYRGYISRFTPSTRAATYQERADTSNAVDQLFGGAVTTVTAGTSTAGSILTAGVQFPVTMVLTKVATGIQINATFNGGTYTATDTTPTTLTFDTFAMFGATAVTNFAAAPGSGLTIDDVVVSTNFAPPPPPAAPMKWAVGNGDWNTTSANWQPLPGGAPITYTNGSEVTFNDDLGVTPVTVNLTATRSPGTVTVNSTRNYTFSGSDISGTAPLTKSGASTLTLASANTYTGATSLNAGTLLLRAENALAGSPLTLAGGTLVFDSSVASNVFTIGGLTAATSGPSFDIALQNNAGSPAPIQLNVNGGGTYSGILSGPGLLLKDGPGVLSLTQANTLTGNVVLAGTGALRVTNPNALGAGNVFLNSAQTAAGIVTFEISGGINFSKPLTIDSSTGREHFSGTSGANTLSSPLTIDEGGSNAISFDAAGGPGNTFTVSGAITAPDYTGEFILRGVSGGILSSTVSAPNATLTLLQSADNVVWTVSGSGSTWGTTRILSAAGPLVGGANQGFSGTRLILGANNALATTASILWANNNNNLSGGTIDLAGFNQTVAGLDKPNNNSSQPLPAEIPPLPPVPNAIPVITNSSATTDSTLTLAGLLSDYSFVGTLSDGPTRKLSLVLDSAGVIQRFTRPFAYTGNTTIVDGTLRVDSSNFADSSTVTIGTLPASPAVLDLPSAGTDNIAVLVIDGVTYTSGEFGALLSGAANETDAITGSGRLNVVAVAILDYDAWVTSFQPGFTNNLPAQDQDGDGLTNRQEYAFGLNPKSGASVNPITAQLSRATGMFTYTRRVSTLATPNLTYVVQTSSTLAAWANDNTAVQTVIGTVGDVQTVEVKLTGSLPLAANPLFVRIKSE